MSRAALIFWVCLALIVVIPGYLVACTMWPFQACPRCKGSGRRRSPSGKNYGRCRRCKGGGEQIRLGQRVLNKLGAAKDKLVG